MFRRFLNWLGWGGSGEQLPAAATIPPIPAKPAMMVQGKCSTFGGPRDMGVSPHEGLAIFEPSQIGLHRHLFLERQPPGTTGLARRLDPMADYLACRWDYQLTPKDWLRGAKVRATNVATGRGIWAQPMDWGPHETETDKDIDLSPGLAARLGLETGDEASVIIYLPAAARPVLVARQERGIPLVRGRGARIGDPTTRRAAEC